MIGLQAALESFDELYGDIDRQHDRVTTTTNILGDLDEAAAIVLLQIEEEDLPITHQLFRMQRWRRWRPSIVIIKIPHTVFALLSL